MQYSIPRNWTRALALASLLAVPTVAAADGTVARQWDETALDSIRLDLVRPPVQARNLFHLSVAMYDAWAAYDPAAQGYLFTEKHVANDVEAARRETISYASYRLLVQRFAASPSAASIRAILDARMAALGYPTNVTTTTGDSPAAVGNRIAVQLIAHGFTDNSHEEVNHASYEGTYPDVNPPLIVDLPFNFDVADPNRYQPLALEFFVDQNGNVIPGGFPPKVCPFWGGVTPFGLQPADQDPKRWGVWFDTPDVPLFGGVGDEDYRAGHEGVVIASSRLSPDDGVVIDIGPGSLGNNPLGSDSGAGHAVNPATGLPYAPNVVKEGDWTRCMAEFWADGPNSTTPPGHWNEIANAVVDHPAFERRFGGTGPVLGELEWDVKMYVALNGALHDAAIVAWGAKGHYDSMRPIGAIRYLSQNGQCSDPAQPSYSLDGIHLVPGVIEVITKATTAPGQRHEELAGYEGQIAVLSWPGAPFDPATEYSGVRWILGGSWISYQRPTFVTPPFPGYVSGHSTFSRAAAEVLAGITGSPFFPGGMGTFTCTQNEFLVFEDGPTETFQFQWATYYDASDASGQSRIWGGIHPAFDDFPGRVLGAQAGQRALAKVEDLFDAGAPACPADLDGSGNVNAQDLAVLLGAWGTANAQADLDGSGNVNAQDLAVLLGAWGVCP
jgi:hypothetical protein